MQQRTPRSEHLTSDAAASSAAANSAAADCAAPSSASALPSTLPAQSTGIPPRKRAIDVIRSLPTMSVPATKSTISSAAPPPQLTFGSFPSAPTSSTQLNRPLKPTSAPRVRARDVLKRISSVRAPVLPEPIQSTAELRHTVRPPKRRRSHSLEVDIDLTKDNSGSDEEERPCRSMFLEPELIYNTNDLLATRQTVRGWNNSSDPSSWILSREEWHSEQVDLDRLLPGALDDYPSFAISAGDMHSLHRYLMARFDIETFDDYLHLLALFRNTQAIETLNARRRLSELNEVSKSLESARYAILSRLNQRRAGSGAAS